MSELSFWTDATQIALIALGGIIWAGLNRRLWIREFHNGRGLAAPPLFVALFVFIVYQVLASLVVGFLGTSPLKILVLQMPLQILGIVVILRFWRRWGARQPWGHTPGREALRGVVHVVTFFPLVMAAFAINLRWFPAPEAAHPIILFLQDSPVSPLVFLWIGVSTVLIAPVFEEFLFRGLLQGGLQALVGFTPALLLQSTLFALLHNQNAWLPLFLFAFALTAVTHWSRSLVPAIVMHILFNAANMAQLFYEKM